MPAANLPTIKSARLSVCVLRSQAEQRKRINPSRTLSGVKSFRIIIKKKKKIKCQPTEQGSWSALKTERGVRRPLGWRDVAWMPPAVTDAQPQQLLHSADPGPSNVWCMPLRLQKWEPRWRANEVSAPFTSLFSSKILINRKTKKLEGNDLLQTLAISISSSLKNKHFHLYSPNTPFSASPNYSIQV